MWELRWGTGESRTEGPRAAQNHHETQQETWLLVLAPAAVSPLPEAWNVGKGSPAGACRPSLSPGPGSTFQRPEVLAPAEKGAGLEAAFRLQCCLSWLFPSTAEFSTFRADFKRTSKYQKGSHPRVVNF